jgi:methyltransferase (TIGR00027 family)
LLENISDTAVWVAAYRAQENERPDAVVKDPFARRLAGERGEQILRELRVASHGTWALVVRTKVLDDVISELVRSGAADTVINMACGLDTRPWRMDLPATLRWVDVDLPGILDYKLGKLSNETLRCRYEAVKQDLADLPGRRALFARIGGETKAALCITEGLLVYLTAEQVSGLAADLHAQPSFRHWLLELVNPVVLRTMQTMWRKELAAANASMHFGPAESGAFFSPFGWREKEFRSFVDASVELKREMPFPLSWMVRAGLTFTGPRARRRIRRYSGAVLLERA